MKIHHKIIKHVNKHHKKYLFGAGVAFGITALKIITIAGVFLGIQMTVGKSNAADESTKAYQAMEVFNQIDDLGHKNFNEISKKNDPKTAEIDKIWVQLDNAYHQASNLNERFRAANAFLDFMEQGQDIVKNLGYTTPEEDLRFYELVSTFHLLR